MRFARDLVVIGAVAASPDLGSPDDRAAEIVGALAAHLDALAEACGWDAVSVAAFIGCGSPDASRWKVEPVDVLESSLGVVAFLHDQVDMATAAPLAREAQALAREIMYLSLETLSRTGYSTASASFALGHQPDGSTTPPPSELVRRDELGPARDLMIRRVNAWFARPSRPLLGVTIAAASSDGPQEMDPEEERELELVGSDYIEARLAQIRAGR